MPGELFEIDGERKKRVVCPDVDFLAVLAHIVSLTQCYFFDSDVGGFHYGPGHPYVQILYGSESNPNSFCSVAV